MKLTEKQKQLARKYKNLFFNTGGNDVVELLEREDITIHTNHIVLLMQYSVEGQLKMLEKILDKIEGG